MADPYDFDGLGSLLTAGEHISTDLRRAMLRRYRREVAALLIGLRSVDVIGQNTLHSDPPDACDACGTVLADAGVFVDGATGDGMLTGWVNLCMPCFLDQGAGIGWGIGQLYDLNDTGWQLIGGGNQRPAGEDE